MKPKKSVTGKKLALNKKTIAHLHKDELRDIRGGHISISCVICTTFPTVAPEYTCIEISICMCN
jgi:hypothetical protein